MSVIETNAATKTITIKLKEVYGETKAYPVCQDAQTFADMLGTKTLTPGALKQIQKLGYTVYVADAFGQRTTKSCGCHVSKLDMATAEIERLVDANLSLMEALRPFADIGLPTNPDYRPEIRLPRELIIAARDAVDAATAVQQGLAVRS